MNGKPTSDGRVRAGRRLVVLLAAALSLACPATAWADAILTWNAILLEAIRATHPPPPVAARQIAMLNATMFDSANAAAGLRYEPLSYDGMAVLAAAPEAAATAAGAAMIKALFPDLAAVAPALAGRIKVRATLPPGSEKAAGLGEACTEAVLKARADDGARAVIAPFIGNTNSGTWRPTPPALAPGLLPQWGGVRPWVMQSVDAFMPPPPPAPGSAVWFDSFNAAKSLGSADGASHSPEYTRIALFWADDDSTETPPGHWLAIAMALSSGRGDDVVDRARQFALLGVTMADAAILVWNAKYRYAAWRPMTAIREANKLATPGVVADPNWTPMLTTPPFPEYPSGHSAFSAAAARVLAVTFGTDAIALDVDSRAPSLPGVIRHFDSLSEAAEEAGLSRVYGGIHFYFAHRAGAEAGRKLADYVLANRLRPSAK